MIFGQFTPAAPEIVLLTMLCVVLVVDLFAKDESRAVTFWLTIVSLALTLWATIATEPFARTMIFDGSYVSDALSHVLKISTISFVAVSFLYARDYLRQNELMKGEYYLCLLYTSPSPRD